MGAFAPDDDAHIVRPAFQGVRAGLGSGLGSFPQEAGEFDDAGVFEIAGCAVGVQDVLPGGSRDGADGGAGSFVEVEPDAVVDPPSGGGVQGGDVGEEVFGGACTVAGDQQVPPVGRGDLVDRGGQDLEVVGDRVAAGVARAELDRQALLGVVAPGCERVMTPAPFVL